MLKYDVSLHLTFTLRLDHEYYHVSVTIFVIFGTVTDVNAANWTFLIGGNQHISGAVGAILPFTLRVHVPADDRNMSLPVASAVVSVRGRLREKEDGTGIFATIDDRITRITSPRTPASTPTKAKTSSYLGDKRKRHDSESQGSCRTSASATIGDEASAAA